MTTIITSLTLEHLMHAVRHARDEARPSATAATIAAHAAPPAGATLVDTLRFILSIAQSAAPEPWIQESADRIVSALLELQRHERDVDPRTRRSHAQARTMAITAASMKRAGHTGGDVIDALRARHGLRRSRVYELLALCPAT